MKISTKGRYGLRAVLDLALHSSKEEVVPLSEIAMRQDISISYLEQLVSKLKKAGIVTSTRGAQGGYQLAKSPDTLSVGDILRALEGELNPVNCTDITGDGSSCASSDSCVTKYVWKRISDSINDAVDTITLSELMEEDNKINGNEHDRDEKDINSKMACNN